jgi:hypothetical protein
VNPLEFLNEEFENAKAVLRETLRHDYGPAQSEGYYEECDLRLKGIDADIRVIKPADNKQIFTYLGQLSYLNVFVSLIERSRLGEFSWPFAYDLRETAELLLTKDLITGELLPPIVHIVAEGEGYRIFYESQVPMATSKRRFVVVQFPRSLKHHVLLHALFGHELGHNALFTTTTGAVLQSTALQALTAQGPLKDVATMNAWVTSQKAPQEVKDALAKYQTDNGLPFSFTDAHRQSWLIELICDFFGFLLFGPAFMAAHRVYLECSNSSAYEINVDTPTHPPFALRHKMLVLLMDITQWSTPITAVGDQAFHRAETELLRFLLDDPYDAWASIFSKPALQPAVNAVKGIFAAHPDLGYVPIDAAALKTLITRLTNGLPPILADIDENGNPQLKKVRISQTLHAGWVYWTGRQHLTTNVDLDFLKTNKLCDRALLQERAIKFALAKGVP